MNGWYLVITQDMVEGLGLRGSELLVYALVNGYSQGGRGMFTGTLEHVGSVCGLSRRTAARTLSSLVERGLLEKVQYEVNGVKYTSYRVSAPSGKDAPAPGGEDVKDVCAMVSSPEVKVSGGSAKLAPNNKYNIYQEKNKPSTNVECLSKKKAPSAPAFDFRKGLEDLGITPETADAWIRVRRSKRAVNSEIALKGIAREIGKAGRPAEECARLAVEQSWQGFNAAWALRYWAPPQRYQGSGAPRQAPRHEDYVRAAEEAKRRLREEAARRKAIEEQQNFDLDVQQDRQHPVFADLLGR